MRTWLHWAQARGNRAYPDDRLGRAHSYQWLGTFGNAGNGAYRKELRRAVEAIGSYLRAHQFPEERALLRLDGLYGTGAVLADLLGFAFVLRGKDYRLLDLPAVQTRLHLPADQQFSRPESSLVRTLYDCPDVMVGAGRQCCRRARGDPSCRANKEADWH